VVSVARGRARVELSAKARDRLRAAHEVIERAARETRPVYGVTMGLGASKDVPLAVHDRDQWERRVLMGRSVAVGPPLATEVVRAVLLARAASLAAGGSGIQPAIVDTLLGLLNEGVHAVVPSFGSIGAGDLAPLAMLALPLIGLGEAEYDGDRMAGADAMRRAGLTPVRLGPKDALALCSANAVSVGHGALVLWDAIETLEAQTVAAALSMEGFRANLSPLDPRAQAARPAPGQLEAAARFRAMLAGSELWHENAARSHQDPLSFRCASQIHGAAHAALGFARTTVEIELNAAGDNPLVVPEDGAILHTGNFHTAALALAFDLVALALVPVTSGAVERAIKLMSPAHSGLPLSLSPGGAPSTGFATAQKTLTALAAEIRHLANPASLDFAPVAEGVEDHATMAPYAVRKLGEIVNRLRYVVAIELACAAQAVDLRGVVTLGKGPRAAWDAVRSVAPRLDEDRVLGPDLDRLYRRVADGTLTAAVRNAGS
jgi:histidine ammonia-lyase